MIRKDQVFSLAAWRHEAAAEMTAKLSDSKYPCHFARQALKRDQLRIGFVRQADSKSAAALLHAYIADIGEKCGTEASREAVIIIEEASPVADHKTYFDRFWTYLSEIHEQDPRGWPSSHTIDPNSPDWMYIFEDQPFFVFGLSPSHDINSSRHLAKNFALVFVPQSAFSGIERGTPEGTRVRKAISQRVIAYEGASPHPSLDQTDPMVPAWKAYFLAQGGWEPPETCPFRVNRIRHRHRLFFTEKPSQHNN